MATDGSCCGLFKIPSLADAVAVRSSYRGQQKNQHCLVEFKRDVTESVFSQTYEQRFWTEWTDMILMLILFKTNQALTVAAWPPPDWLLCVALLPVCNVYNVGLNPALWRAACFFGRVSQTLGFDCVCVCAHVVLFFFLSYKRHSLRAESLFPLRSDFYMVRTGLFWLQITKDIQHNKCWFCTGGQEILTHTCKDTRALNTAVTDRHL